MCGILRFFSYCLICLLVITLTSGEKANGSKITNTANSNGNCKMLSTSQFRLDLSCIKRLKPHSPSHALMAPSLESCKEVCCNYSEGPCDMVYWNNNQQCILINYYILNLCPLYTYARSPYTSITLLLSVSNRVNPSIKRQLLLNGDRDKVRELLGCSLNQYVCDDWSCISNEYVCDGHPHCSDGSDEMQCLLSGPQKCFGIDEKYYNPGEDYTPFGDRDHCKKCVCGNDSLPIYCLSASCDPRPSGRCTEPFGPDRCCRCRTYELPGHPNFVPNEPTYLTTSQRLIVSCMAILVVVTLLLLFSRNVAHRARRAHDDIRSSGEDRRTDLWMPPDPRFPRNRSFFSHYVPNSDRVSFFDQDGLPAVYVDVPPPYSSVKPPTIAVPPGIGPPPSYPSSVSSEAASPPNADTNIQPVPPDLPTMQCDNDGASTSQPITARSPSNDEPISPLSTTSESPLLHDDANSAPR